jgi:hypothetical protein
MTVDEQEFTPWCEPGWAAWNNMSPEVEFCTFAASLARMMAPSLIVETGVGQGYMTRSLPGRVLCYEADPDFRFVLQSTPLWTEERQLSVEESPSREVLAEAQLTIHDSNEPYRQREIALWVEVAPSGAVALVHDTGNGHAPDMPQAKLGEYVRSLSLPGVFLRNPRGAWLGIKP